MKLRKRKSSSKSRHASTTSTPPLNLESVISRRSRLSRGTSKKPVDSQRTIEQPVTFEGAGVHSGQKARMVVRPARSDSGIRFCRIDLPDKPIIPATVDHVCMSEMMRCTILGAGDAQVATLEHLLSVCGGLGIDNALIEIDGGECPILDGSGKVLAERLLEAGIKQLRKPRRYFELKQPISCRFEDVMIVAVPSNHLILTYFMDYDPPYHLSQQIQVTITPEIYVREVAPARTYVFYRDVEMLRERGMIKGGTIENALVLDEKGRPMNEQRFTDEGVRHKILDLLGDLMLLGRPLKAHVIARRSGHASHIEFVKRLQKEMGND